MKTYLQYKDDPTLAETGMISSSLHFEVVKVINGFAAFEVIYQP